MSDHTTRMHYTVGKINARRFVVACRTEGFEEEDFDNFDAAMERCMELNDAHDDRERLIAAAPDLLAACEAMRNELHAHVHPSVWEMADAAIAKAKGA